MKTRLLFHSTLSALLALSAVAPAIAQGTNSVPEQALSGPTVPPSLNESLNNLADQPATHTGFVFDRSMLQAARSVLQAEGMTPERAAAALSSISLDSYHYPQPVNYTPAAMASIVAGYRAAGWKHLVDAHGSKQNANTDGSPKPKTITDLWLHFSSTDVDGVSVITRGSKTMNVVQVACDLRPMELLHLGGHFGIPKVDPSAVMVPDPKDR